MHNQIPKSVAMLLKDSGFVDSEITILTSLLVENGQTLRQLSRNTGKSTGVLDVSLKKLIAKRIIRKEEMNSSPTYFLHDPQDILKYVAEASDQKMKQMQAKTKNLELFVKSLSMTSLPTKIRYFHSVAEIQKSYDEILSRSGNEICGYFSVQIDNTPIVKKAVSYFIDRRIGKKIFSRTIAVQCKAALSMKLKDKQELRETRIVKDVYHTPSANTEVMLSNQAMHIASAEGEKFLALIIEDENIIRLQKSIFELAWKAAESEDKKIMEDMKKFKSADKMFKSK